MDKINYKKLKLNPNNPRKLQENKKEKLINSLLIFPAMLSIRPQVCNSELMILGGNARHIATKAIAQMSDESIETRIRNLVNSLRGYGENYEDARLVESIEFWKRFKQDGEIPYIDASNLSESEQREFIIKDNQGFGDWDFDSLANSFDINTLLSFGFEEWELGVGEEKEVDEKKEKKEKFIVKIELEPHLRANYELTDKKIIKEAVISVLESL